jgi:hypothetical protein
MSPLGIAGHPRIKHRAWHKAYRCITCLLTVYSNRILFYRPGGRNLRLGLPR